MATKKTGKRGNSEGSIRQRADGRWEARLSYRDERGVLKRKAFYGQTQREASDKLREARQQQSQGIQPTDDRLTYGKYLASWLEHTATPNLKPSTIASYRLLVDKHIRPSLGHLQLTKLDPPAIRRFLALKLESGLSSRTVQYLHAIVRKSLSDGLRDGLIARNAAAIVKAPRAQSKPVEPLSPDQVRTLLAAIAGDRLEALITTAVALGLRQGECFALQWQEIDFENRLLHVRHGLVRTKDKILMDDPKTKKAVRTISLPAVAVAALQAHRHRQELEREFAGSRWVPATVEKDGKPLEADLVFRTTIGTPLDRRNVTQRFQEILKACGLPRHRFHDLRHSAATMLLAQNVHPRAIQQILGWDSGLMLERYTHLLDQIRVDAASKMDDILKPVGVTVGVKTGKAPVN
jgi:integrase